MKVSLANVAFFAAELLEFCKCIFYLLWAQISLSLNSVEVFGAEAHLRKIKMIALLALLCPTLTRSNDFFDCEQASRQISDAELAT